MLHRIATYLIFHSFVSYGFCLFSVGMLAITGCSSSTDDHSDTNQPTADLEQEGRDTSLDDDPYPLDETEVGDTIDSSDSDPDGEPNTILGYWIHRGGGGWWNHRYMYDFAGTETSGQVAIRFEREDWNSTYAECILIYEASGTWAAEAGQLDVIPLEGTAVRVEDPWANIGCDETFDEREMTEDELRFVDRADGTYEFDRGRLWTTRTADTGNSTYRWERE